MIDFWKLPKNERTEIEMKMQRLTRRILKDKDQIAHLEPWLNNVKEMLSFNEKDLAELKKTYNLEV